MRQPALALPVVQQRLALLALFAGALGIAFAPIFVRISEVGPVATAFWRVGLALPVLMLLSRHQVPRFAAPGGARAALGLGLCGLAFAGDLALWHYAIGFTTIANATLLANLAPVFVALVAWLVFGQALSRLFVAGLVLTIFGAGLLSAGSASFGAGHVFGDVLGVLTALFYAAYQLSVARLRRDFSALTIMAWSTLATAIPLLILALALGEPLMPHTVSGWASLFGIALISHVGGQSLIAYGFAALPLTFSSLILLIQPVAAAFLAWALLAETLSAFHLAGAVLALIGIYLARRGSRMPVIAPRT
jgi:drug/metabolite transporter (DMT)-like permease